ncbi:aminoglycoside phosphotransferase family protein [Kribbella sp. NBC_00709]|uniref:aminoglycoside phosphotransferase family protein n=1 Tax=Kribbella sp. NBC_00709 TaxID=2975972 RepID=UPI002E2A9E86|nr:aminoglycoside phosphotransferase family protein [Kribbella sp. NBC_00709]
MRVVVVGVSETSQEIDIPDGTWFANVEATVRALRDQGVDTAVLTCLSEEPLTYQVRPSDGVTSSDLAPWTKPEWYDEALPWIAQHVEATGPWTQVRSWGLSNVLRIPTASGDVYFKAIAHSTTIKPTRPDPLPLLFAHEPLFLQKASEDHPGAVPAPLAIESQRAWMLLPDLGTPLAAETDIEVWIEAVRRHARLQRSYVNRPERLLEISCADRGLAVLDAELDRLLGPTQATDRLEPHERAQLPTRAKQLREAITELSSIGLPETLLHGDLHPGNVAVRDGQVLAFDWTDASLSHPFLDLVTFIEEERSPLSADPRVLDAYLGEWEEYASPTDLRHAFDLATQLGALHQTMTYAHLLDHVTGPSKDSMLRGGVWWLRQLLKT